MEYQVPKAHPKHCETFSKTEALMKASILFLQEKEGSKGENKPTNIYLDVCD